MPSQGSELKFSFLSSQQRRLKYEIEKQRIAEENERRRRKRCEIEAAKLCQEEAERRQQQEELERKRKAELAAEQRQLELDEHMKRERENAEKYAHPPDLATVNEDPREDDHSEKLPPGSQVSKLPNWETSPQKLFRALNTRFCSSAYMFSTKFKQYIQGSHPSKPANFKTF
jgi:hypothetical protein